MDENKLVNLDSLKNVILDERKLVTYTSISKDLSIHVNRAKILLQDFITNLRKTMPNVDVTVSYLLSGISENNEIFTSIVLEKELDGVKEKIKTIYFEHIYSVCYGRSNIDKVAFVAENSFEDYLICNGRVKSENCVKRTFEELGSLKTKCQVLPEKTSKSSMKAESINVRKEMNNLAKNEAAQKGNTNDQEVNLKKEVKSEIPSPKKFTSATNGKTVGKHNNGKAVKGIMGFFSKTSIPYDKGDVIIKEKEPNQKNIKIKEEKLETEEQLKEQSPKAKTTSSKMQSTVKSQKIKLLENKATDKKEIKMETSSEENDSFKKSKSAPKKSEPKSIKTDQGKKKDKKRKRVFQVSDSESESEKNDPFSDEMHVEHESEDEIPPTPSTNIVKITSGLVNPKKRRRIVDKTYTDEEGFILTKKEEIYESCSDEEVNTKENVNNKTQNNIETTAPKEVKIKNSKKKASPPQKGKQPTMMNFFKKVPN